MKSLLFLRHAKSDWNASFGHDHERPINKRGRGDARRIGRFLAEIDYFPDRILSSSAVRARTTLEHAVEEGGWGEIDTKITDELYEASILDVLELIRIQNDACSRLLLVGHEPTWSTMVARLIGSAHVRVSTATLARVDVKVPRWADVDFERGELRWLVPAKLLRKRSA